MKLVDLKIGTQLRLGLGLILAFVVVLGVVSWRQANLLWLQTRTMYDHPLQVRRAIGMLEADIRSMHDGLEDLVLAEKDQDIAAAMQEIETRKATASRQLEILYDRYLGPRDDIASLDADCVKWNVIVEETIRLHRAGKTAEAAARSKHDGAAGVQLDELIKHIGKVDDFARNKAEQIYTTATEQSDALNRQLAGFVAAVLLLSILIAKLLLKGIKTPLAQLTAVAEQLRQGKLGVRSGYVSANEFGALSAAFNIMADTIQTELQTNENAAQLAGVMLREEAVQAFCRELLKGLLTHTGSQVGAVYFLNEAKTAFECFDSIGLGAGGRAAFSATELEGELGVALATRRIQRLTDIPVDTRFAFAAVSGEFMPREILTIPVLSDHTVTAVISLASVRTYDAPSVRLVNDIWSVLTARVNGVLAFRKIQDLAERLEQQNRELDAQKRVLSVQADELTEQNAELEMQKRELDKANRLKSAFLSNMSHELRTPLNSVIALSGVLNRRLRPAPGGPVPPPSDPVASRQNPAGSGDPAYNHTRTTIPPQEYGYLEVIERNGRNLLALINDILDLSRIEAGREDISVSRFSVRELVGEIVAMLEPQAREKNIALLNQMPADLPPISSDPAKCRHILQNLVGNAVKFTEHGQITITGEIQKTEDGRRKTEDGGQMSEVTTQHPASSTQHPASSTQHPASRGQKSEIHISVADTGIGIAADQLDHIFEEFRQADDSTSRKYGGTGLGLAIAKKYALLLGGGITVQSAPGKGSTFTLRLPLVLELELELPGAVQTAETGRPFVEHATRPTPDASGQGPSLLLVEDDEPAIVQLTDILQAEGYRVQVARGGKEALAQIEQTPPDAMILDLMMPEVDGFQVLKAIRSAERTAHLPVLILTAKLMTQEELSFLKGNQIHQLIQRGDINKAGLLAVVARMVAPRQEEPTPPSPRRRRPARPGKPVVLVVEDNPDNLRTARALLEESCQVIEAVDGQAGVEQARRHQPDLILMDIALPRMDGVQALQELRKDETLRHIPVIAVTASAMKGDRTTILAHGFDGYISKPIDHDVLKKTLRELLD